MLTRFEHFAVTEMMGEPDTPPRANGTLCFRNEWERTAFGVALALAKQGYFEWDDFRDELIAEIGAWETAHLWKSSAGQAALGFLLMSGT
jgi:hypothetical protein